MSEEGAPATPAVRKRRGKVLYQLLILCLVIGIGPLVVSSRKLMEINQRTIESGILNSHTQLVETVADGVEAFLRRIMEALQGISRFQGLATVLDDAQRQMVLIHFLDSYDYLQGLKVFDQEGREVSDVSRSGASRLWDRVGEGGIREAFTAAIEGGVHNGTPFVLEGIPHSFMDVAVPLRDEEGMVQGAFLAIVSLVDLQNLISKIRVGATGRAYLVDHRGRVIAHRDLDLVRKRENFSDMEIVGNYLQAGQTVGSVPFLDRQGRQMLGAYDLIEGVNWGVVVEQLRGEAYYSLQEMRHQTIIWVVIGALLATVIGATFARKISNPIHKFAETSMAIADGNFKGHIDVKARNEIGQLAETFNYMTGRLDLYDRNMRDLFLSTIKSLAAAIDAKDPYTRGHSDRVARFSLAIAREMNLDRRAVERVQIAALLHDVGKIGIDDAVLRKPERLTDEEYAIIKRHPAMGANIMGPIKQLKDIIPGMRHHHEALDGSGYPDGLAGGEIPLVARIIAVADTFDAMTSDRLYQKAMDDDFVIKTLIRLSGARYDPKIVQAFIAAHSKAQQPQKTAAAVEAQGGEGHGR
ncbi:HD domain-containing phosphohydrolase [Candidatus Moduliflexota bacterium]